MSTSPIEAVRLGLQREIRRMLVGDQTPVRDLSKPIEGDPGLFGPDSVTWRVHSDASMLVGGVRALLLQTMHPLAMAGVAQHSAYKGDPTGRLWRTATYVGTTSFGTREEAERAVAMVRRVHESVVGTAGDGRPYAANDPHLLGWVHHTLIESFLVAYRRYGAERLAPADADRYVAEQAQLAELIGAVDPAPARSVAELRAWMHFVRPELRATREAREAIRFLLFPPLPLAARGPYAVLASAAVGLLPLFARIDLRIPTLPGADRWAVRPAARTMTRVIDWAMTA